mmetsp:Transcript_65264/g.173038  ORF Transcript_65264/g.173038 Transcript_65264/m.173038 type:complete len:100 (+) Transcript_65264:969-1268(+)
MIIVCSGRLYSAALPVDLHDAGLLAIGLHSDNLHSLARLLTQSDFEGSGKKTELVLRGLGAPADSETAPESWATWLEWSLAFVRADACTCPAAFAEVEG